jgi:glycosyltransferase involved in cell wall biosynthesis
LEQYKLNILITVSVRWWNANAYYAISLAEALSKLGHKVYVAGDPEYPPTIRAQSAGLQTIEIKFASFNPFILLLNWYKLYKFVKDKKIEIINAHRSEDHLLSAFISRRLKIPLVRTLGDVRSPKDNFINRWLHFQATDFHISSSESNLTRYISTWPGFQPKSEVLPGGINSAEIYKIEEKSKLLEKFGLPTNTTVVGIIARLSPVKDHATFIMSASLIYEDLPDAIFLISGLEVEIFRKELKSFAESLNLNSNVYFLDRHEPVNEILSVIDVGVIASKGSEVISRVAMEYLAMGIPVVTTDINVLPEIIENERNGYVVEAENPYQMSRAITKILQDDSLRVKFSEQNLIDFKNKFDINHVAKSILEIYNNLVISKVR